MSVTGRTHSMEPDPEWTDQEILVWLLVREGEIADLNQLEKLDKRIDPKVPENWNKKRILGASFLETILLDERYQRSIHRQGVRIVGAWFNEPIDLSSTSITCHLGLCFCLFDKEVKLRGLRISQSLHLFGSNFIKKLDMFSLTVLGDLLLFDTVFRKLYLSHAKIEGSLTLRDSHVEDSMDMLLLHVGGNLDLDRNHSNDISLNNSKVEGNVSLNDLHVNTMLDMRGVLIRSDLYMHKATLETIDFSRAEILGSLHGMAVKTSGPVQLFQIQVSGNLHWVSAELTEINLTGAIISRDLSFRASQCSGKAYANDLRVGGSFFLINAKFASVELIDSQITGNVSIHQCHITERLNLNSTHVKRSLQVGDTSIKDFNFLLMEVGGFLRLNNLYISGEFHMNATKVSESMLIDGVQTVADQVMSFAFAEICGDLDISGKRLPSLDLSCAKVHGKLSFGVSRDPFSWQPNATLDLRDAEVGYFEDGGHAGTTSMGSSSDLGFPKQDFWPKQLNLSGFTYSRLPLSIAERDITWHKKWLEKSNYSPQPYQQLGEILEKSGYKEKANEVLYAQKNREWSFACLRRKTWLLLLWLFIGYGFRVHRSLYWVLGLTGLGVAMLLLSSQGISGSQVDSIFYTLDIVLPVIVLDKAHEKITLTGFVKIYFYFLKVMGYVLASFLIAGLAGLIKK